CIESIGLRLSLCLRLAEVRLLALERGLLARSAFVLAEVWSLVARAVAEVRPLAATRTLAATGTLTDVWPLVAGALAAARTFVARLQHLPAASAAIVELAIRRLDGVLAELVLHLLVVIAHTLAVLRVVLPVPGLHVVPIYVLVDVHVLVDVDVDVAVPPIEIVPDGVADLKARAPGDAARHRAADDPSRRGGEIIGRVCGIIPGAVHH